MTQSIPSSAIKARRGDLAVITRRHLDFFINRGISERFTVEVAVVTNLTRDGLVKCVRFAGYDYPYPVHSSRDFVSVHLVSKDWIDVEAAMSAARAHVYSNSDTPKPYDSLDGVRTALRPHLKVAQARD